MEGKKTFLLNCSIIDAMKELTNEEVGIIFMQVLKYVNDQDPEPIGIKHLDMAFNMIKGGLKQDLVSWKKTCGVNKINGKQGGRPKNKPDGNE